MNVRQIERHLIKLIKSNINKTDKRPYRTGHYIFYEIFLGKPQELENYDSQIGITYDLFKETIGVDVGMRTGSPRLGGFREEEREDILFRKDEGKKLKKLLLRTAILEKKSIFELVIKKTIAQLL